MLALEHRSNSNPGPATPSPTWAKPLPLPVAASFPARQAREQGLPRRVQGRPAPAITSPAAAVLSRGSVPGGGSPRAGTQTALPFGTERTGSGTRQPTQDTHSAHCPPQPVVSAVQSLGGWSPPDRRMVNARSLPPEIRPVSGKAREPKVRAAAQTGENAQPGGRSDFPVRTGPTTTLRNVTRVSQAARTWGFPLTRHHGAFCVCPALLRSSAPGASSAASVPSAAHARPDILHATSGHFLADRLGSQVFSHVHSCPRVSYFTLVRCPGCQGHCEPLPSYHRGRILPFMFLT